MRAQSDQPNVESAYSFCRKLATEHYENFPVASLLLPPRMRRPMWVVYAFARRADDLADEGALSAEQRLARLDAQASALDHMNAGAPPDDPVLLALQDVVRRYRLSLRPFRDLLSAFRQDVTKNRYETFDELEDYCRRSATPVGRLVLALAGRDTSACVALSDAICTGLQLTNFIQDIAGDWEERERIYLPREEMNEYGVDEAQIAGRTVTEGLCRLMAHQRMRARSYLLRGSPIGRCVGGRLGLELRLVVAGGLRVLERLDESADPFTPVRLRRRDWVAMAGNVLTGRFPPAGGGAGKRA